MGIGRDMVKKLKDRIVGRYGEKLVSSIADTSADSPSKFTQPKRDLYEKLAAEGKLPNQS